MDVAVHPYPLHRAPGWQVKGRQDPLMLRFEPNDIFHPHTKVQPPAAGCWAIERWCAFVGWRRRCSTCSSPQSRQGAQIEDAGHVFQAWFQHKRAAPPTTALPTKLVGAVCGRRRPLVGCERNRVRRRERISPKASAPALEKIEGDPGQRRQRIFPLARRLGNGLRPSILRPWRSGLPETRCRISAWLNKGHSSA